jgi:hypothetical protein
MNWKTMLVAGAAILMTGLMPGTLHAIDPGEGVLRIEKRLLKPDSVRGSVADFSFDVTNPAAADTIVAANLVPQPFSDGTHLDSTQGSVSTMIGSDLVGHELGIHEQSGPDWVTTFAGDCDVHGRITVPPGGFVSCEVTNTYVRDAGDADTVLTLAVTIDGGVLPATTDDFSYIVGNDEGEDVAGPLSAEPNDNGFLRGTRRPTTSGTALVALDYTPAGASPGDPSPTFMVRLDRNQTGWVVIFGGDCESDGSVNPALRTPTCSVTHVFVDSDVAEGEGLLRIDKSVVAPALVRGSVEDFSFDVTDPSDGDSVVVAGMVPQSSFDGTRVDGSQGSVASVIPPERVNHELQVHEESVPDWVATYSRDCDSDGRVTVPVNGFVTCQVTNTFIENSEASDAVLTLEVTVEGGLNGETTAEFVYLVQDDDSGQVVAGPLSAHGGDAGSFRQEAGRPSTAGTAVIPLDYTPDGWSGGDPQPTFTIRIEQPSHWVTSFGGDCGPDGGVDPALRTPVCRLTHLFVDTEVAPGEGVLIIDKRLVKPDRQRGSVADFSFDVTDPLDGDRIVVSGLSPQPFSDGTRVDVSQGSVATVIGVDHVAHPLVVSERVEPDWVITFAGDCDPAGRIVTPPNGIATCQVTNTYASGSGDSDAVLTLNVTVDGGLNTATTVDFAYIVTDNLGHIVAGPLSATGADSSAARQEGGGPSTSGTATVPLDYTPGGGSPTFVVSVDVQPGGWATNFGGDCGADGGINPDLRSPVCTVDHLFVDPAPNLPQPQAPVATNDLVSVFSSPFIINADVLANDYDADGNLDPSTVTIVVEPGCASPDAYGDIYCNTSVLADGTIRVDPLAIPLSGELTYQVCDTTDRCDTAVLSFHAALPPVAKFYRDADEDTYGDPDVWLSGSSPPEGYVTDGTDCDDDDKDVNPGADEIIGDEIDNDCDGFIE